MLRMDKVVSAQIRFFVILPDNTDLVGRQTIGMEAKSNHTHVTVRSRYFLDSRRYGRASYQE